MDSDWNSQLWFARIGSGTKQLYSNVGTVYAEPLSLHS